MSARRIEPITAALRYRMTENQRMLHFIREHGVQCRLVGHEIEVVTVYSVRGCPSVGAASESRTERVAASWTAIRNYLGY
jgi:hypothetical protein